MSCALAHSINVAGRAESANVTVSCAPPSRDGPRSVELASNNASGPPMTGRSSDTDAARTPVASTSTPAARTADRRQPTIPRWRTNSVVAGGSCRRRRRVHRWGEQVAAGRVDRLLCWRRRRRRRGTCRGGGGGRCCGFGRFLFFLGARGGDTDHGGDRYTSGNSRKTTSQER
jgi:hypothetical protein